MSEMQVSMLLTLENLASSPLAAFADQIKRLEPVIASLNAKFATFGRQAKVMGDGAASGSAGVSKLESTLAMLGSRMASLDARLNGAAESFTTLGASARAAGGEVKAAAIGMDSASASTQRLTGHVYGLSDALKGMAEIWAGMKIEHGIKASVKAAADMMTLQAQMRSMGYSQDAIKYGTQGSWQASKQVPQVSAREAMAARIALMTATGTNNEKLIDAVLPQVLRNALAYRANFSKSSSLGDIIGNMGGLAELRGMSQTPAGLIAASNQAMQMAEATGGRMKLASQEMVGRQYKYGGAQLVSEQGYKQMMSLAEQYTLAGHEGGGGGGRGVSQMGTAYSMLLKVMNGGQMAKQTYEMLKAMDAWEKGTTTLATSTTQTATTGSLRGALEGQASPAQWVHDVLIPRMLAYATKNAKAYFPTGNISDPKAQMEAMNKIAIQTWGPTGGVNVANLVSQVSNPQVWGRVMETAARANQSPTGQKAVDAMSPWAKSMAQFSSALDNLKNAIGTSIMPVLNPLINWFADFLRLVGKAAHDMAKFTEAITIAAGAFGAFLTVAGSQKLFGKLSDLFNFFKKVGPAAAGAGAETEAAAVGMAFTWRTALASMAALTLKFVGWIGTAFLLYEAGENTKIAGITINNYIRMFLVSAAEQFDKFFTYVSDGLNKMSAGIWGGVKSAADMVGMSSVSGFAGGKQQMFNDRIARSKAGFATRDQIRSDMFGGYMSPQGQPGYIRPGKGAPDAVGTDQAAQAAAAAGLVSSMGGIPDLSHAGHTIRHHAAAKPKVDTAWNSQVTQAANAVKSFSQKDSAAGIRKKWDQYKAVLAMSGQDGLAQLAGQHGDQLASAFDLKEAKTHLAGLQSDLSNETKLNAAKVTAGVFTQDQGQQATLAAQKNAAPGLLAAALAVKKLEQAAGQSTAAIDTTIVTINALGNALTQFQQKLVNGIQGSFAGLFSNIMHGKQSFRSDMAQFITGLSNTFISTLSSSMADGLVKGLFSSGSPLGNLLKGMGSGSDVMKGAGSAISSMAGSAYSWLSSFAVGADNIPNDMVANIHKGEMIVPARGAEAIRSGKLGGSSFNGDVNVVVNHDGTAAIGGSSMSGAHQMLGQMIGEHVRGIILQEQRPGGLLGA